MTRKLDREKGPKMSGILECTACGKTTAKDGLELMPSGRNFKRHTDEAGERCTGGQPQTHDPEPVTVVKKGTAAKLAECVECGTEAPALKTPGKVRKHQNPETLADCEQRPSVEADCPVCEAKRQLRKMRFPAHKDLKANTRCIASGKTVAEATGLKTTARKAEVKAKVAKPKAEPKQELSPLEKSIAKAKKLGEELKGYPDPWRYKIETGLETQDPDQATLILTRGKGADREEMGISWWSGACYGGDLRIFHTYRNRTIAVRNANAVRQRAALSHEAIVQEHAKVSARKAAAPGPRKTKTPEEMRALMPFDPAKATDDEILAAVLGKQVKWHSPLKGSTETDVVKGKPTIKPGKGGRNLSFTGVGGSRTVKIENLVSVG